jgi:galactitol-specific phosphotransferase system IIB component
MAWAIVMTAICATGHATAMLPAMKEEEAAEDADLVAGAKVIAVEHRDGDGGLRGPGAIITIDILTKGVSAKQRATVFWSQTLADASMARPRPPLVGQTYRVHLRSGWGESDFEPVSHSRPGKRKRPLRSSNTR